MKILELFNKLANSIPDNENIAEMICNQDDEVKKAILNNNSALLRSSINKSDFYANETRVTVYVN